MGNDPFDEWLHRWHLVTDGKPVVTHSSRLLPVRLGDMPAMLKIATIDEERRGAAQLAWWDGAGCARVLKREADAVLLERALGQGSLVEMAQRGEDAQATQT